MFSVFCTVVAAEVLLGPSNIEGLLSSGGELAMEYRCACGERGVWRAGRGEPDAQRRAS
jgi:hypothetical protein